MPTQIETIYQFNEFHIYVERNTAAGIVQVVWWYDVERDGDGNEFDVWLKLLTTEAQIDALKAGRITCRAFWRAAEGLTLTRERPCLGEPQSKSIRFEDVQEACPREGHYLYVHHQPEEE